LQFQRRKLLAYPSDIERFGVGTLHHWCAHRLFPNQGGFLFQVR
jgi:hypothetical protein